MIAEPLYKGYEYNTMTEIQLIQLAREGKREAYDEIYLRHRDGIQSYVTSIIKNPQEAEDLTQILFGERLPVNIKILSDKAKQTGQPVYLRAWLYRVARNMSFNISRDRRRRNEVLARSKREHTYDERVIDKLYGIERNVYVTKALGDVSKDHRIILELRYKQDLSYGEIAKTLGIKLGTVMSRLSRARDRLLKTAPELEELLAL